MDFHYCPSEASKTTVCEPLAFESESPTSSQPLNFFSSREDDAQKVLQTSTNFNEIRLVLTLFPFKDSDTRFALLSKRWSPRLDSLLTNLPGKDYHEFQQNSGDYNTKQKAEEILRRTAPSLPNRPIWNTHWSPPVETPGMSPTWIASEIDKEMSEAFSRVTFPDLIKEACGYQTHAVAELLEGVDHAQRELRHRFHELFQPKNAYELAEKELKNPLAKWAVYNSISDTAFSDARDALDSIFIAIQDLFTRQDLPLIPMLRRLAILSTLHQNHILNGEDTKWESLLIADFWFLKQISDHHPSEVAQLLTNTDHAHFRELCANDFLYTKEELSSNRLRQMNSRWSSLVDAVKICLGAHSDLFEPTCEVAEDLFNAKNYFSGMALLQGLRDARCYPTKLSKFWKLLNPENMYANYRTSWSTDAGLAFLFPHVWKLRRTKDETERGNRLSELFQFVAYPGYTEVIRGSGTKSACVLGGAEADNEDLHISSRLWALIVTTFIVLGALLPNPRRCWAKRRNQFGNSLGHDIEKGIQPAQCLDFLQGPLDRKSALEEWKRKGDKRGAVSGRPRVTRGVRVRIRSWCENCQLRTGRRQGGCIRCKDLVG